MQTRFRSLDTRSTRKVKDSGFSFIELLAYMAIAALLILAAIPQFNQYREKATISNMQGDARNVAQTIEAQYTTDLAYPSTISGTGKTVTIGSDTQTLSDAETVVTYTVSGDNFTLKLTNDKTDAVVNYDSAQGGLQKTTKAPAAE